MPSSIRAVVLRDFSVFFSYFNHQAAKLQQSLGEELASKEKVSISRVHSLITNGHFMYSACIC